MIYKEEVLKEYQEALKEKDPFMRKLRLAFCVVLIEDRRLLEELAKQ